MKKFLLILFLFVCVSSYAQEKVKMLSIIRPEYVTVALDSTTTSTVYYIWPLPAGETSPYRNAPSETAPTSASYQAQNLEFNSSGGLTISIVTDTLTAQDSDSLYAYVQTLIYDKNKTTWYKSTNDTLFLVFDTPGTYTATSVDYLDWTHGYCYTADVGSGIMPGAGLAVTFGQITTGTENSGVTLYVGFWCLK